MKLFKDKKTGKGMNYFINILYATALLCAVYYTMFSIELYYTGYHSMDLGHNSRVFEIAYNVSLLDKSSDFNLYTPMETYIRGINYMEQAFKIIPYACFLIGFCIAYFTFPK